VDWKSFKELSYTLFAVGMFFVSETSVRFEVTLMIRRCFGVHTLPTSTLDPTGDQ
jgi:hypothetical protein